MKICTPKLVNRTRFVSGYQKSVKTAFENVEKQELIFLGITFSGEAAQVEPNLDFVFYYNTNLHYLQNNRKSSSR